jgi:prevent-host-death family protein
MLETGVSSRALGSEISRREAGGCILPLDMPSSAHYSDHMAKTVTATEAKARILALLDEVEAGEEVEITRHGRLVARIVPVRGGSALRGRFAGRVRAMVETEDELFSPMADDWNLP